VPLTTSATPTVVSVYYSDGMKFGDGGELFSYHDKMHFD